MSGHKSTKKGSNIICRVSNVTPEMVCSYVKRMPKQKMKEDAFRDIMGKSWFQNEHQAPEQWGLYYIDGTDYYPRFDHDITIEEAEAYLYHWMRNLIVINPYTRFKKQCNENLVESIVGQLENNPNEHDLKTIIGKIIDSDEPFVINEIIANALNNYSRVLKVETINKDNEQFNVSLIPNYKEILKAQYNMTKKEYFELFDSVKTVFDPNAPIQQIFYGCPGSGKSHEVRKKTNTAHNEGFAGLSSIERQQAYQKYLDDKNGHKKNYKGGKVNIIALTHPKLMSYIASCTEYEINSLFEISNEEDFNAIIEALKGCEAYQNDSITKGSGCHWETGLKSYGEFLKDQILNTEPRKDAVFRTTFHPDTDYASFVGCYKPCMNDGVIEYSFTPQVFTNAYIAAWENTKKPVYLVIEEINRGNCAQIFGDLFQLLDRDKATGKSEYPIKADKDLVAHIEKVLGAGHEGIKNGELCLPPNLIIYATMNTSDQSLFPMDSAFKRRWDWEYVPIEYGQKKSNNEDNDSYNFIIKIGGNKYKWIKFLRKVNDKIYDTTLSEDKQMGNYFIKGDVDELQFVNKVMFYLWNEVCKEEYKTQRNFFRKGEAKDNEECQEFKFVDLFTAEEGKDIEQTRVDILTQFMAHLEVTPEPEPKGENSEPKNNEQPAEQ